MLSLQPYRQSRLSLKRCSSATQQLRQLLPTSAHIRCRQTPKLLHRLRYPHFISGWDCAQRLPVCLRHLACITGVMDQGCACPLPVCLRYAHNVSDWALCLPPACLCVSQSFCLDKVSKTESANMTSLLMWLQIALSISLVKALNTVAR